MLQKELIKRLKGKYETKMDDKGWLNFSSDGILLCKVKYDGNCIINDDENLSEEYREKIAGIQDEVLTVREYIGLYERAPQMKAAGVTEYKQLASFGDTVLAATYNEKNGFMFCTWKQNADGDSVFWGDYSPNYEYVKEAFAVRSSLVSKHRLFSEKESADHHAHKRGVGSESTYKGNAESCDPRYSFHWTGTGNTLYLFEAPIDKQGSSKPSSGTEKRAARAVCCSGSKRNKKDRL